MHVARSEPWCWWSLGDVPLFSLVCVNDTPWEAGLVQQEVPGASPGWESGNYSGSTLRLFLDLTFRRQPPRVCHHRSEEKMGKLEEELPILFSKQLLQHPNLYFVNRKLSHCSAWQEHNLCAEGKKIRIWTIIMPPLEIPVCIQQFAEEEKKITCNFPGLKKNKSWEVTKYKYFK